MGDVGKFTLCTDVCKLSVKENFINIGDFEKKLNVTVVAVRGKRNVLKDSLIQIGNSITFEGEVIDVIEAISAI